MFILIYEVSSKYYHFLLQIVPALAMRSSSQLASLAFGHAAPFLEHFLNFLALQQVLASSCIFPTSGLEPHTFLQGTLVHLIGEWCLETKAWMDAGLVTSTECHCF